MVLTRNCTEWKILIILWKTTIIPIYDIDVKYFSGVFPFPRRNYQCSFHEKWSSLSNNEDVKDRIYSAYIFYICIYLYSHNLYIHKYSLKSIKGHHPKDTSSVSVVHVKQNHATFKLIRCKHLFNNNDTLLKHNLGLQGSCFFILGDVHYSRLIISSSTC